jgi:RNA polymerase sigma-70 factor (ECF subfamily)
MSDVEAVNKLVESCQRGDMSAFAALFRRYQDRIYDLACTILRDEAEAEDLVQDVFVRVFERIDTYKGAASFETWLVTIAVNKCRDRMRRRKLRRALSLDDLTPSRLARILSSSDDPQTILDQNELHSSLWTSVMNMDERFSLPLILRYRYGLSCGEVAEVLGCAIGTVYSRLSDARRQLRQMKSEQREESLALSESS